MQDTLLAPISQHGKRVVDLLKTDRQEASQLMESLSREEQISIVSHQASKDPRAAQELLFLLDDNKSRDIVEGIGDRTLFRIMKSQSSTHIGVLTLVNPDRVQSILDLDQELFSTKGVTDPQTAYHWMVSFLEEDDATFSQLLSRLDIRVVASAFQDKIVRPSAKSGEADDEEGGTFPADFMVKLDRNELKPDDLEVSDEETLDILTRIYLTDEAYFIDLISIMLREEDLKTRSAEEAFDRIQQQVGDMSEFTEEADEMFIPLDE
ncbi:MAG: hypothetical protein HY912_01425 [Desulfomonile tiedjei]|uniref:Uncharacterized protein n=1 Tax=Desulfomonile tiedjei TaxID=2358 RepID=A0A9D6YYV2_9BACT|nr:hypothetical protein [Desulfomonile tiedjei]